MDTIKLKAKENAAICIPIQFEWKYGEKLFENIFSAVVFQIYRFSRRSCCSCWFFVDS